MEALENHEGWEFGGTMVLDLTFESQLECYAIVLTESGFRACGITPTGRNRRTRSG